MSIEMKAFFEPVTEEYPFRPSQVAEVWMTDNGKPLTFVADVFAFGESDSQQQRMAEVLAASSALFKALHDICPRLEGEDRERAEKALALVRPFNPEDTSRIEREERLDALVSRLQHDLTH